MIDQPQGPDFSMVIASTVHDMKNSLTILSQAHHNWVERLSQEQLEHPEHGVMEYEFARLNGMLVQLLGLYKLGVNQLPMQADYHDLDDFIEAQLVHHKEVLDSRGISASYSVDGLTPLGFFDRELIGSVLNNIMVNAIRYADKAIAITAGEQGGELFITINDDGRGYPASMIEHQHELVQGINPISGSTGLGLYFAGHIASLHARNGVAGRVELANGGALGGGLFTLYLP
ncbi:sensor histidine kinase [Pseudomonas sp. StFLB209]|uniref:sensor histidine kinase n=1 Tax=Pseudomonas sp. StFLB209 TaxID=1028989 RepID=UPI0004F75F3B|nr:HAMP domain-containing sensor histidine kinase [Pseudomonas sp. StFLB209]BAP44132.1 sensor histidine kinase [Pseudomonas sp. StFLB209]